VNRAVIWDLDGTLVASAEQHWQAWREILAAEGISIGYEQFRATFGLRNEEYLPSWLGPGASPEDVKRIGDAKEARYRRLLERDRPVPLPGAMEWIERLAQRGWRQAVATSAPRLNVEAVVAALAWVRYFGALVAAEDVRAGKPMPDVFLLAARRLDTPARRCVVVEDAAAGIAAARRAGMACIGVGPHAVASADVAVSTLLDLDDDAFDRLISSRPKRARH
jgi:HAD superfamily hydrolase (TIGR01509 family)